MDKYERSYSFGTVVCVMEKFSVETFSKDFSIINVKDIYVKYKYQSFHINTMYISDLNLWLLFSGFEEAAKHALKDYLNIIRRDQNKLEDILNK